MNQNQFTFQSQNLVEIIFLSISGPDNIKFIAKYLFEKFDFNSTFAKGQNETAKSWFYFREINIKFLSDNWNMIHQELLRSLVLYPNSYNHLRKGHAQKPRKITTHQRTSSA